MISKPFLNFLIVCFWASILLFVMQFVTLFAPILFTEGVRLEQNTYILIFSEILLLLMFCLFFYSLYFFFKYDRYSKSGVYFFFFHIIYSLIYFYRVIWKRKRELVNSYECEPVLGNTIMLETEEFDDIETEEEREKNLN